jgi:hypothetical protein
MAKSHTGKLGGETKEVCRGWAAKRQGPRLVWSPKLRTKEGRMEMEKRVGNRTLREAGPIQRSSQKAVELPLPKFILGTCLEESSPKRIRVEKFRICNF